MTNDKIMINYPLLKYACVGGNMLTRKAEPFLLKVQAGKAARSF
jgi:hypothetical protein